MNKDEFKQSLIEGRKQLLDKIIDTFKSLNPVAIHQFGSGTTGFKDEFSDLDIWVTFKDDEAESVILKLNSIFKSIAPVLVRHYSKTWSPIGGSANQVIHETDAGLFIVDYYISKLSETSMPEDSVLLYGSDRVSRGEWKINKSVKDAHILKNDINWALNTIFISVKGIVRHWDSPDFVNNLKIAHQKFRKRHKNKIKRRKVALSFKFDYRLLSDLYPLASQKQKKAIAKIKNYLTRVERLYIQQT